MSFPYYKQPDSMDCGPTCLRMVAKHYKRNISLQYLREKTQVGKEGVNLLGISEAAEVIGLRTQSIKIDYTTLIKDARLPAIVHWNQNHFVVLYKTTKNKCYVADPAKGLMIYNLLEFKEHWISDKSNGQEGGIALLLEPSPNFYKEQQESVDQEPKGLHFKNIFEAVK